MNNLHNMLELQGRMNAKINPEWLTAGYEYLRAAALEGGEALESLGWKWWKHQVPDLANVKVELVDIWHFILSEAYRQNGSVEMAADFLNDEFCNEEYLPRRYGAAGRQQFYELYTKVGEDAMTAQDRMELLVGLSALRAPLDQIVSVFNAIRKVDADMSDDELYAGYVSKNVLNFFRQDHGYKAGTYIKDWHGEEDNVVMTRLASELTAGNDFSEATLYDALAAYYVNVVNKPTCPAGDAAPIQTLAEIGNQPVHNAQMPGESPEVGNLDDVAPDNTYALKA